MSPNTKHKKLILNQNKIKVTTKSPQLTVGFGFILRNLFTLEHCLDDCQSLVLLPKQNNERDDRGRKPHSVKRFK